MFQAAPGASSKPISKEPRSLGIAPPTRQCGLTRTPSVSQMIQNHKASTAMQLSPPWLSPFRDGIGRPRSGVEPARGKVLFSECQVSVALSKRNISSKSFSVNRQSNVRCIYVPIRKNISLTISNLIFIFPSPEGRVKYTAFYTLSILYHIP